MEQETDTVLTASQRVQSVGGHLRCKKWRTEEAEMTPLQLLSLVYNKVCVLKYYLFAF
jgi:hypothetical protein